MFPRMWMHLYGTSSSASTVPSAVQDRVEAALAAKERLSTETDTCVVYLDGLGSADESWDGGKLWAYLWDSLNLKCPNLFRARFPGEECNDVHFKALFSKERLANPVTLILDEADSLLQLSVGCIDEFFHTIRSLKNDSSCYNLHGFLLVGVETVKDLLEAQYDKRTGESLKNRASLRNLSPFPHDRVLLSTGFSLEEIEALLRQAEADRPDIVMDVKEIAASVMELTGGHKGLAGTCLAYLVQERLWSYKQWINRAESYHLASYIFGRATYSRIVDSVRREAASAEGVHLLTKFLEVEGIECGDRMVVQLRDLIARGVLVATGNEDGSHVVRISSPLLRTAILRGCSVTSEEVEAPPSAGFLDRKWVILQALKTWAPESLKAAAAAADPSQYAHQFAFMCRIKAVLKQAFPLLHVRSVVLPQVREVVGPGKLRLDTLVRDGDNLSRFGFELAANGSLDTLMEHLKRAKLYHEQHSAQVFLIHFCRDEEPWLIVPEQASVTLVSVKFKPSGQSATVEFIEANGEREAELTLRKWNGKISFEDL